MNQSKLPAQIGLVFTTLAWGATFVLVKEGLKDANPFIFAFYRFLLAALVIIPFIFFSKQKNIFSNFNSHEIKGGILCGLLLYMGYGFQNYGLEITTPSKSAFITSMSILLVPIFVFFIKHKKINKHLWVSIVIAIIGLYLLLKPSDVHINNPINTGDFLTFGCAIMFALHIIVQGDFVIKKINLIRFFIIQSLSVSVISLLSSFAILDFTVNWSYPLIMAIVITAIFGTTFAIFTMIWAQKKLSASETAIIFSMEPVFAAVFSIILGVESFSFLQWVGGVIIVLAVIYYSLLDR
tara:strand:+ start:940 stop:1824 length:885 start_codon:yes stop_codon:yes gene_type:complete